MSFCKMPDPCPLLGSMSPGPLWSACLLSPSASPSEHSNLFIEITDFILLSVCQKPSATIYCLQAKAQTFRALNSTIYLSNPSAFVYQHKPSTLTKLVCPSFPNIHGAYPSLYFCLRGFSHPGYHLIYLHRYASESQGKAQPGGLLDYPSFLKSSESICYW